MRGIKNSSFRNRRQAESVVTRLSANLLTRAPFGGATVCLAFMDRGIGPKLENVNLHVRLAMVLAVLQ